MRLTLPAAAKLELSMCIMKGFLRYTEHSLDAQRGWDLPFVRDPHADISIT